MVTISNLGNIRGGYHEIKAEVCNVIHRQRRFIYMLIM